MYGKYDKKKLGKWVLIYVAIGALVYGLVYYFFLSPTTTSQTPLNPYPTTK
jgi:hypothetical protein